MRALTVYSTRGGNGKTLTALFLGIAAVKRGLKTVVIDADFEAPSLTHLLSNQTKELTWVDYLENDNIDITDLINPNIIGNLDIIFSPPPRIGKNFLGWKADNWWKKALQKAIVAKKELELLGYDLVIIDNQSGTSYNSVNNMVFSEISIMVLRPSNYGLGATESILKEIFNTLKGMNRRMDYYLWNQVHRVSDQDERLLLDQFLEKWDDRLTALGLKKLGSVEYNIKLNLELLNDNPDLNDQFNLIKDNYNNLMDTILNF